MLRARILIVAVALALAACAPASPKKSAVAPTSVPDNPFLGASTLPFAAPPFDKIKDSDFQPAIQEGMKRQRAEIGKIAADPDQPTFDNTIVAMERSGAVLTRVSKAFFALAQSNTNDTLQKVQREEAPKQAEHRDAIFLDAKLFARVKSVYDARDTAGLDAESKRLVERYYANFVRAGARLSATDQAQLREINKELSSLSATFRTKLLGATKAAALEFDSTDALAGMNEADLAAAAEAAKARKREGKWVITLQNTTQQPAEEALTNRATRAKLFEAAVGRAERGDDNDTRATITRIAELRALRAHLFGFDNYAQYALEDQMAKTPERAIKLMTDLVPASLAKARSEARDMEKIARADGVKYKPWDLDFYIPGSQDGGGALRPWDWQYYAEQVRKRKFKIDGDETRQYFLLDRVLQDGVFFAANKLYGITFKERHDIPVYQPDVRVFEVFDQDGTSLALFYADYFKRDNKAGGAWMSTFVDQSTLLGTKSVVYNVCNFTKPAAGQPALISHDDVITMFHEFGHALHGMFSNVKYPLLTGTSVPRDFVEFPSQFNEHWADEPAVFANYAKHFQTGHPMPDALVAKIKAAGTYGQGFATTEYLGAALLDMAWHTLPQTMTRRDDVGAFERAALKRYGVDDALIPPRYRSSYFAHIWGTGYAAAYYAYLWTAVLRDDAFYWFRDHGGMTRENGQRFRDMVLSRGNSEDLDAAYRAFRGRDPSVEPLLLERGLKAAAKK